MRYRVTVPDQEYFDRNIPCRTACPIHTECGRYVQAIGISREEEAYLLARAPNPFAYVLGRICAHPCEDACRRGKIDEPIAICALKRYATERHNLGAGHDPARKDLPPAPKRGKNIAIVGAGVCGLTCAHDLALLGYSVEIFESAPVPGGMLYLGIPHFRLPREIIKMEVDNILAMGVKLHTRMTLGRDISFSELRSKFDAVLLATGLNKGRDLNIPGAHLCGRVQRDRFSDQRQSRVTKSNWASGWRSSAAATWPSTWRAPRCDWCTKEGTRARARILGGEHAAGPWTRHAWPCAPARNKYVWSAWNHASRCLPGKAKFTRPNRKASRWITAGGRRRSSAWMASWPG